MVQLSIQDVTQESKVRARTRIPLWEHCVWGQEEAGLFLEELMLLKCGVGEDS